MDSRVRLIARRGSVSQGFMLSPVVATEKSRQLRAEGWEVHIVASAPDDPDALRLGEPLRPPEERGRESRPRPGGRSSPSDRAEATG